MIASSGEPLACEIWREREREKAAKEETRWIRVQLGDPDGGGGGRGRY
jgi:hypothetical protein